MRIIVVGLTSLILMMFGVQRSAAQEVKAAQPLSLQQVYALLRERNPRLKAAAAVVDATAARAPGAGMLPDPAVQVGLMNLSLPSLAANMPSSMAPAIQTMQMVPFPGKLSLASKSAVQSTELARAQANETWWKVRSQAAMAFYDIYSADRQTAVMTATLRLLSDFHQVALAMYSSGTGRQSDVLRASVEVARMKAEIERMRAMRTAAAARLNSLLDRPGGTQLGPNVPPRLPLAIPATDALVAWAEETRPMLDGGRTVVERARTQVKLARKEIWPDVTVGLQYGQRPGEAGTERMGSLMFGFTVPVFASRRQLRLRDEASALERMSAAELSQMRADVGARITEVRADLERDRTLVRLYSNEIVPEAKAMVKSALSSYRVGTVDFETLADAQMTANRYEQELYALIAAYGTSLAELEMAVGRELQVTGATLVEVP